MRFWSKAIQPRRRLVAGAALVALSVALHAAVLAWAQVGLGRGMPPIHGERLPVRAVQVSQVGAGPADTPVAPVESAPAPPQPIPPVQPALSPRPAAHPMAVAASAAEPTSGQPPTAAPWAPPEAPIEAEPAPTAAGPDAPLPAVAPPVAEAPTGAAETPPDAVSATRLAQDYHPGRELTRRPLLMTPITLDLPIPDFRPDPSARLRMRLLIGADGRVDHVLVEASTLDPLARDAAIARFAAARYAPGEIQGEPVRSQVLIEVGYSGQ